MRNSENKEKGEISDPPIEGEIIEICKPLEKRRRKVQTNDLKTKRKQPRQN